MVRPVPSTRAKRYVQDKAVQQMTEEVVITQTTKPTLDRKTGIMTTHNGDVVYKGKARIWQSTGPRVIPLGDSLEAFRLTKVNIPFDDLVQPHRNDQIKVVRSDDPLLVNKVLRIIDVSIGGTFSASRLLTCIEHEGVS